MRIYAGVTTLNDVERCLDLGARALITNPEGMAQFAEVPDLDGLVTALRGTTDLPMWIQIPGRTREALVARGRAIAALAPDIGVKIVCDRAGIEAIRELTADGVDCMATAVFSTGQALMAAAAGARAVCPFVTRSLQAGRDPWTMLDEIVTSYANAGTETEVVAASLTGAWQVVEAARVGVTSFAVRLPVLLELLADPATTTMAETFATYWARFPAEADA